MERGVVIGEEFHGGVAVDIDMCGGGAVDTGKKLGNGFGGGVVGAVNLEGLRCLDHNAANGLVAGG